MSQRIWTNRFIIAALCCMSVVAVGCSQCSTDRSATRREQAQSRTSSVAAPKTQSADKVKQPTPEETFEASYPLNGTVMWHTARIYEAASTKAKVIGYARRGTKFRAAVQSGGEGCTGGWYRVPGQGFICTAQGYQIGELSALADKAPMPPALDSALPYPYGRVVRDGAPQYWTLPTREQEIEAMRIMEQIEISQANATATPTDAGLPTTPAPTTANPEQPNTVPTEPSVALPEYIRMRMEAGYYVSLDRYEDQEGEEFFRTVRGGYLRAHDIVEVEAPPMRGVIVGASWSLPIGFVWRAVVRTLQQQAAGTYRYMYDLPRHTPLALEQTAYLHNGQHHALTKEHMIARRTAVRVAEKRTRPPLVPKDAKWIFINLTEQMLTAYEGDTPVFVTLVSSGREEFPTPKGIFRVTSKHVTSNMDDFANSDEAYSIEDVPWVIYFHGSYALHGAFWHNRFGMQRSHGCVNLSPVDARWLFQWSTPELPFGWHGVFASATERPGTWVVIDE